MSDSAYTSRPAVDPGPPPVAPNLADPATAYPAGQALALRLRKEFSSNGLIFPSVRYVEGTCLVAFRPDMVLNLRQGKVWRLEWQGNPIPTCTRI